jgi:cardiolipin synthase
VRKTNKHAVTARALAGVWELHGGPLPDEERPDAAWMKAAGEKATRVVIQEPGRARVLRTLEVLLATADKRMWISDAYFLSAPTLNQALISAARDGVDVRILLPATNDVRWVGALSRAGYRPLLEEGVRIFEYGGPMMHAKTHVVDGKFSRVGSTNLNVSGLLANWVGGGPHGRGSLLRRPDGRDVRGGPGERA